tara:strand:- start:138 stop:257 length:120 start_codon:yes stop_codon:yes gene_type:complete
LEVVDFALDGVGLGDDAGILVVVSLSNVWTLLSLHYWVR